MIPDRLHRPTVGLIMNDAGNPAATRQAAAAALLDRTRPPPTPEAEREELEAGLRLLDARRMVEALDFQASELLGRAMECGSEDCAECAGEQSEEDYEKSAHNRLTTWFQEESRAALADVGLEGFSLRARDRPNHWPGPVVRYLARLYNWEDGPAPKPPDRLTARLTRECLGRNRAEVLDAWTRSDEAMEALQAEYRERFAPACMVNRLGVVAAVAALANGARAAG